MATSARLGICLLNISEARNKQIVEKVAKAATQKCGDRSGIVSTVLNIFQDKDYNRSVLTIAAPISHLKTSVCDACEEAYRQIDMSVQQGVHPRLGSVDLIPIYPLSSSVSLEECGKIARSIADHLVHNVPGTSFFLFGTADWPEHRALVPRRKAIGWFKGRHGVNWNELGYDVGAAPSARYGITGIGASYYVMNCNVTIRSQDLAAGREIAAAIRGSSPGGLPGIQAMAFPHEGNIEIACNVDSISHSDVKKDSSRPSTSAELTKEDVDHVLQYTPPEAIEQRVGELAAAKGIGLVGTALVGFRPEEAWRLAVDALRTGQDQFWKNRGIRMM